MATIDTELVVLLLLITELNDFMVPMLHGSHAPAWELVQRRSSGGFSDYRIHHVVVTV